MKLLLKAFTSRRDHQPQRKGHAVTELIERHLAWLKGRARPATVQKRQRLLKHLHRALPYGIDRASEDELIVYFANYEEPWTRYTYDTHARGFYKWAVVRRHLTIDPMAGIPKPRHGQFEADPCSDGDLAVALGAPAPYGRAMLLASRAGLRCGEIARARRKHLTTDQRLRVVGKGGKVRYVPLDDIVLDAIAGEPDWLLGAEIDPERLTNNQRTAWRRVGLPDTFHLHQGRHWFATGLSEAGVPVEVIQEILGHASLDMTRGYLRMTAVRTVHAVRMLRRVSLEPVGARLERHDAA